MELCGSTSAICLTNPAEPPVRECHARPSVPYGIPLNERRPRGRRHNGRGHSGGPRSYEENRPTTSRSLLALFGNEQT
jgi:hypothetical protein